MAFGESLSCHDSVEELTSLAVLHHNVNVAMVNVALVELDDVRMINSLKDCQFFLQQSDVFGDVFSEDRLDGVGNLWVRLECSCTHRSKVATTDHLNEVVD